MHKQLGEKLRTIRQKRGMSLRNVSEKSGLSTGFLSQLERGMLNPTISTLQRLSEAFGTRSCDLLDYTCGFTLTHSHDRPKNNNGGADYHVVHAPEAGRVHAAEATLQPGCFDDHVRWVLHGELILLCRGGNLHVDVDGDQIKLVEGDSITIHKAESLRISNPVGGLARYLVVSSPPMF